MGDVVAAVESDVALVIAVLRLANRLERRKRGKIDAIVTAVEVLTPEAVEQLAAARRDLRLLRARPTGTPRPSASACTPSPPSAPPTGWPREVGYPHRDRLLVTALLHDVGKLVLIHAYPGYPEQIHGAARTPEERLHRERRELGVDHALVGGVLARRWGLPKPSPRRSSATTPTTPRARPPSSAWPTCSPTTPGPAGLAPNELLRAARAVGFGPSSCGR